MINYNLSTTSTIELMNNVITIFNDNDFEDIINKSLKAAEDDNFQLFVKLPKNYYALFLLVIPLLTIIGNGLVIASVLKNRALQTATNFLIVNLAVADFLVALCVMPFAVYVEVENSYWRLPKDLCHMYMAMDVCASTASILNLVAISWDRYIAVSRPMLYARKAKKLRGVVGVTISIWVISIFIAVPMITGLNKLEDTERCEFTNATYIVASSVGSFFVPCVAILILYTVVLKTLQSRQRLRRSQMKKKSSNTTVCSLEAKTFVEEGALGTSTVSDEKEATVYTGTNKSPQHDANGAVKDDTIINLSSAMKESQIFSSFALSETPDLSSPSASIDLWQKRTSQQNGAVPFVDETVDPTIEDEDFDRKSPPRLRILSAPLAQIESVDNIRASFREKISISLPMSEISPCSMSRSPRKSPINRYYDQNRYNNCENLSDRRKLRKLNSIVSFHYPLPSASAPLRSRTESSSKAEPSPTSQNDKKSSSQRFFNNAATTAIKNNANSILNKLTKKQRLKESRHFYKEKRATHTLAVVLVVFLLCWVPFFTCHMSNSICMLQFDRPCVSFLAFFLTTWLGYMNSFMNPVIYTVFNGEYRKAFAGILFPSSKNVRRGGTATRSAIHL